jgi:hypothetical protein
VGWATLRPTGDADRNVNWREGPAGETIFAMKLRLFTALVLTIAMASPALARNYYVVQNIKTHKCSVLPKKPKGKSVIVVSGSSPYKTRAEARAALRTLAVCRTS